MTTLFAVRYKVESQYRPPEEAPDANSQYIGTFTTREVAEEHIRQLDREAKRSLDPTTLNPFAGTPFTELTTFPSYAFRDWLRDADIEPPPVLPRKFAHREQQTWVDWWGNSAGGWTPSQRERVWEGLNLQSVVGVEVVEVNAVEHGVHSEDLVVFAVVHRHWEYDDSHYRGANDAMTVFRTRERAEGEARRLSDERQKSERGLYWNGGPDEFVVVELTIQAED